MPHQRNRFAAETLTRYSKLWPVVGVIGARQTGKTTLLRDLLGIANYVTLDDEDARQDAENSAKIFLSKRNLPLLIDEVQKVPKLFDACKVIVDRQRIPGQFYLTGSTEFSEKVGIGESLTGRIGLLHLFPLTLAEGMEKPIPKFKQIIHLNSANFPNSSHSPDPATSLQFRPEDIARASRTGGMPVPMFLRDPLQQNHYWSGWLDTTLYRDLFRVYGRNYSPDIAMRILSEFAKALREGEWPSLHHFSIDSRKLRKYLVAMETIFLIRRIPAHPQSIGGDVWMLLDSGLAHYLMKGDSGEGAFLSLIRHTVLNELRALLEYSQQRPTLTFYRSAKGSPVDLVCEDEEFALKFIVQGRSAPQGFGWHERAVAGSMKKLNLKRGFLVTPLSNIEIPEVNQIGILPWSYWS